MKKKEQHKEMEVEKIIEETKDFFKKLKSLDKEEIKQGKVLFLSFGDLKKYSPKLTARLIEAPEETFQIIETALDDLIKGSSARVRFIDIPDLNMIRIEDIRAKHLNKLISIEGYLVQASDVRPQVVNANFECPSCGTIISVLQIEKKFIEPARCSCKEKGPFILLSKAMVDTQRIIVADSRELQEDGIPKGSSIQVFIQEDLTDPDKKIFKRLGKKIRVLGVLKEIPVNIADTGEISTRFDIAIESNNLFFEKTKHEKQKD